MYGVGITNNLVSGHDFSRAVRQPCREIARLARASEREQEREARADSR